MLIKTARVARCLTLKVLVAMVARCGGLASWSVAPFEAEIDSQLRAALASLLGLALLCLSACAGSAPACTCDLNEVQVSGDVALANGEIVHGGSLKALVAEGCTVNAPIACTDDVYTVDCNGTILHFEPTPTDVCTVKLSSEVQ